MGKIILNYVMKGGNVLKQLDDLLDSVDILRSKLDVLENTHSMHDHPDILSASHMLRAGLTEYFWLLKSKTGK